MKPLKAALAALLLAAAVTTAPETEYVCNFKQLPGAMPLYEARTEEEEFFLRLTACYLWDGAEAPEDITAEFQDKERWGIPADAERGFVFRIRPMAASPVTADQLAFSVEAYLDSGSCPERLTRLVYTLPGSIESLAEAGFASVEQAQAAGFDTFFVDTDGFWGLEAGWRSIADRTRLRDWAVPAGANEMYVTPAYLYSRYLQTGGVYEKMQPEFVGVALSESRHTGILTEDGSLILIFPVGTTASVVEADLAEVILQDGGGTTWGPYAVAERRQDTLLLTRSDSWWGEYPCEAPSITCRIGS